MRPCGEISAGARQDGTEARCWCGPNCGWLPARSLTFLACRRTFRSSAASGASPLQRVVRRGGDVEPGTRRDDTPEPRHNSTSRSLGFWKPLSRKGPGVSCGGSRPAPARVDSKHYRGAGQAATGCSPGPRSFPRSPNVSKLSGERSESAAARCSAGSASRYGTFRSGVPNSVHRVSRMTRSAER